MYEPIVKIKLGQLKGRIAKDMNGRDYYSFQGIPYAKPPIGNLRFKAPQPPTPWIGVKDATCERDSSYQRHFILSKIIGSEDCLHLNVYTKTINETENLKPVMVWICGGSFISGSADEQFFGPQYLIAQDIVLVTINYRVGILGFLSLEEKSLGVPGNAGLKDQVMALTWVRQHITSFGGDPNNVTIFGESAGAGSVHLLLLSPLAKGLFHKAIAQSGTALNTWSIADKFAKVLAKNLKINPNNEKELYDYLMKASVEEIFKEQEKLPDSLNASTRRLHGPVIERSDSNEETFISDEPINIIRSGNYNKVPLIVGYTSMEGLLFAVLADKNNPNYYKVDFERMVPHDLKLVHGSDEFVRTARKIKKFYFDKKEPSEETIDNNYLMRSDIFFIRGVYNTVKNHLLTSTESIYLYRFSMDASLNLYKIFSRIKDKGVCHGDDLGYLFRIKILPKFQTDTIEEKCVKRMITMWTNFAKTGNPNPLNKDNLINVEWKPVVNGNEMNFLDIDVELTAGINPENDRMKFWDDILLIK